MYIRTREGLGLGALDIPAIRAATASNDDKLFVKHKKGGYHRYGGGRVEERLKELRDNGRLEISDADIDMLQRIANVETKGQIQGINNYDSAFMSMGFMQWTIKFDDRFFPDGKLQRLIRCAPESFRKYEIELDGTRRYKILAGKDKKSGIQRYYQPIAIKGAEKPNDLRSLDWAKRFYAAGLDPGVIVKEARLALKVIEETKNRIIDKELGGKKIGGGFVPYYERSVVLRALIQETFNHRPTWLYVAIKRAIEHASKQGKVSTDQFLEMVRSAIKQVYQAKEKSQSAENLICKTKYLNIKGYCS